MKKVVSIITLLIVTIFLIVPAIAAENLCFQWTYGDEDQKTITGFRLLKDSHTNVVVDSIAPEKRLVCVPDLKDQENHNYFLVAVSENGVSGNSDIAFVPHVLEDPPPAKQSPVTVGQFLLTVEQVK